MPIFDRRPATPRDRRRRHRWIVALGVAGLGLAAALGGCSSDSEIVACPRAAIMPDLQAVLRYKPGAGRSDADLAYGVKLLAASVSCGGKTDKKTKAKEIEITSKLGIAAQRTDTKTKEGQVTYFAAVVNRNNTILAKRDFTVNLKFEGDRQRIEITDELNVVLPLAPGTSGGDYAILYGFQLSPEELKFNRDHLKLPGSSPPPSQPGAAPAAQPGATPPARPGSAAPAPAQPGSNGTAPSQPHL